MNKKSKKSMLTEELLHSLSESKHIDEFLQSHESEINNIDLQTYLYELVIRAGLTIPQMIEKASISRSLAYQIFNGQRLPNRNLIIRMALIMKLSLQETQRLLKVAKRGELYPRIQRDAAIIFCIQHKYSLIDTNELLENLGEAILLKED
jgi:transcriptional regulator with XRE-family HTH domain